MKKIKDNWLAILASIVIAAGIMLGPITWPWIDVAVFGVIGLFLAITLAISVRKEDEYKPDELDGE